MSGGHGPHPDPCGCCEAGPPDPAIHNRPGLPALSYRVGTYPTLLARMLARIPTQRVRDEEGGEHRPLRALTTRAPGDPSIALLDAWAVVGDVLTFYQERIANEGFLRTATERRSIHELARTIGYELRPGVAASAHLAFTVETAPGAPVTVEIPAGTRIRSVPKEPGPPQPFETRESFTAHAAWNALRPRLWQPQRLDSGARTVYLAGSVTALKAGMPLCFIESVPTGDGATQRKIRAVTKRVAAVDPQPERGRTRVELQDGAPPQIFLLPAAFTFATLQLAATPMVGSTLRSVVAQQTWRERDLAAQLRIQRWQPRKVTAAVSTTIPRVVVPPAPAVVPGATIPPASQGLYMFRVRSSPFGHNAPRWDTLPAVHRYAGSNPPAPAGANPPYPRSWDGTGEPNLTTRSQGPTPTATESRTSYQTSHSVDFFAERALPEVVQDSFLLLENTSTGALTPYRVAKTAEASLADFSLSARATGFTVSRVDPTADAPAAVSGFRVRATAIHAASEALELIDLPLEEPIGRGHTEASFLTLDDLVLGLKEGQAVAIRGERVDLPGIHDTEVAIIREVVHSDGLTTLFFEAELEHEYVRDTVHINANVVLATHGERVDEVLGSGAGMEANQRFALKKPPLTHLASSSPGGPRAELEVRVDGIRWEEARRFLGHDERSEVYIVRIDEEGKTQVIFGDGERGARLPTGVENVVASYRSGVGTAGMVEAETLTLLQTRPLGIREVVNPLPARGAAEPEDRESARSNAPRTVLTMERIVSLRDYGDFARGFAGVGKARAVRIAAGEAELVHVSVADAYGNEVPETSTLYRDLEGAIAAARDPGQRFQLASFQLRLFGVAAALRVEKPRYLPDAVLEAAREALETGFGFERRQFGQPVSVAEVVTVLQRIPGVVAVDVGALYPVGDPAAPAAPGLSTVLFAANARRCTTDPETILPAELLLVNPAGIALTEMEEEG